MAKSKELKPYTVILQFEETMDGYISCPDLIHVMATDVYDAQSKAENELITEANKVIASRDDEDYYESEYRIPSEMENPSHYAINTYFTFAGHIKPASDY